MGALGQNKNGDAESMKILWKCRPFLKTFPRLIRRIVTFNQGFTK